MRRSLTAAAVGLVLASGGAATAADGPFQFKPIDTNKLVVGPTTQATGFLSGATNALSRAAGNAIESNGITRTINNLFGTRQQPAATQPTGLPPPSAFPSTSYKNSFVPAMPTTSRYQR